MNSNNAKGDRPTLEISSQQIMAKLAEIQERIEALETVECLANQAIIEKHVSDVLAGSEDRRIVLKACETAKTREQLAATCGKNSRQALDHHLKPLREGHLVHGRNEGAEMLFEWTPLMSRLSKPRRRKLLD